MFRLSSGRSSQRDHVATCEKESAVLAAGGKCKEASSVTSCLSSSTGGLAGADHLVLPGPYGQLASAVCPLRVKDRAKCSPWNAFRSAVLFPFQR